MRIHTSNYEYKLKNKTDGWWSCMQNLLSSSRFAKAVQTCSSRLELTLISKFGFKIKSPSDFSLSSRTPRLNSGLLYTTPPVPRTDLGPLLPTTFPAFSPAAVDSATLEARNCTCLKAESPVLDDQSLNDDFKCVSWILWKLSAGEFPTNDTAKSSVVACKSSSKRKGQLIILMLAPFISTRRYFNSASCRSYFLERCRAGS